MRSAMGTMLGAIMLAMTSGCDDDYGAPPDDVENTRDDEMDDPLGDGGSPSSSSDASPTFLTDVLPILQAACSCHRGSFPEVGLDLSDAAAYETLLFGDSAIGVALVEPTNADASYLVLKLRGTQSSVGGSGSTMPIGSSLSDADRRTIEAWVNAGAPE